MSASENAAFDALCATPHFSWHELRAPRNPVIRAALRALCVYVLEPLRLEVGGPLHATGYRDEARNAVVGGAQDTQHARGEAGDVMHDAHSSRSLARAFLDALIPFDQLIWYPGGHEHVHISYVASRRPNRHQVLCCTGPGEYVAREP